MKRELKGTLVVTKDLFIETIGEIRKQYDHDKRCSNAFRFILPDYFAGSYDNHFLRDQLIKLLQIAMDDNHEDGWIEYYIWELDFGRAWKKDMVKIKGKDFRLQTPYDLWKLLNLK